MIAGRSTLIPTFSLDPTRSARGRFAEGEGGRRPLLSQQRYLPDMGLMDYEARFYSPALMRFIQPDTSVPDQRRPQYWNRFLYGLNNPVGNSDPTDHWVHEESGGGGNSCNDPLVCALGESDNKDGGTAGGKDENDKDNEEDEGSLCPKNNIASCTEFEQTEYQLWNLQANLVNLSRIETILGGVLAIEGAILMAFAAPVTIIVGFLVAAIGVAVVYDATETRDLSNQINNIAIQAHGNGIERGQEGFGTERIALYQT